jgi:hypothetical protein
VPRADNGAAALEPAGAGAGLEDRAVKEPDTVVPVRTPVADGAAPRADNADACGCGGAMREVRLPIRGVMGRRGVEDPEAVPEALAAAAEAAAVAEAPYPDDVTVVPTRARLAMLTALPVDAEGGGTLPRAEVAPVPKRAAAVVVLVPRALLGWGGGGGGKGRSIGGGGGGRATPAADGAGAATGLMILAAALRERGSTADTGRGDGAPDREEASYGSRDKGSVGTALLLPLLLPRALNGAGAGAVPIRLTAAAGG